MPPHVSKLIQNSLHIPQHRNTPSLVAREYISFYEQEEDRDDTLLKLAKLNFNLLRLRYFQELKTITKWWREVSHSLNLPHHFKERTIEAWFSALMMYFEPKFSLERIITTKLIQVMTFLDQACDVYGSVPEVESLVDSLERWDPDYMENLQGHMKTVFKFVMCFFKECGDALELQGRSFVLEMLKEEFMQYTRASLKLLKWAQGSHVPSFGDFMEVGGTGVGNDLLIACCIMGLEEIGGKEAFEWLRLRPKLVQAFGAKLRILDDITDFEEDMGSGYTANGVNYYMNEHEVTKEEANRELEKMIGDINKIANEECLNMTTTMPHRNIMQAVRFGRAMDVLYIGDDVYNNRDGKLKEYMNSLLVDPIRY
uniref:Alpha-barbatene synthase n=2 Tax=Noccaea caerulescens TaxID=107243 RepID=A0A1J3F9Q5_NOCCA